MPHRVQLSRRQFLGAATAAAVASSAPQRAAAGGAEVAKQPPFEIHQIQGSAGERGRSYGRQFREEIAAFLDREIYSSFVGHPATREQLLGYARQCASAVRDFSPEVHEELLGIAEGSGLAPEEAVLITLHEELYHRSDLPLPSHCTAVAAGPPATAKKGCFVGQTWDWMPSVAGLSTMLRWETENGPSVLAYAYPGLWIGAGLNSAGLALCWTSADLGKQELKPRVGVPSYALIAHLLYQPTLEAALTEARKGAHAGWFTFVMADGEGRLANIEGSPAELAIEEHQGLLSRVSYGSRRMTKTPAGKPVELHPRCAKMYELLEADRGRIDLATMQRYFADPSCGICAGANTLDLMVFDTVQRQAWLSRGESYGLAWRRFGFEEATAVE